MSLSCNRMLQVQFTVHIYEDRLLVSRVFVVIIGTAVDLSELNKWQIVMARHFNLRNGPQCGLFTCHRSEYVSKVVHGWPNNEPSSSHVSPAAHWCQRGAETVAHCSQRLQGHCATNHQQLQQNSPDMNPVEKWVRAITDAPQCTGTYRQINASLRGYCFVG